MFVLDKWYLDLVTPDGATFIGYSGILRWHRLRVGYEAYLCVMPDGAIRERSALRRPRRPQRDAEGLLWRSSALRTSGTWRPVTAPVRRRLHDGPRGSVVWLCTQPRACARVHVPGHGRLEGTGYVERLRMTVAPTTLGFDTLHWGRFHGETETLVWIEWQSGASGRWIFRNGVEQTGAAVHEHGVSGLDDGAGLRFTALRPLRDRRVLPAFASVPGLRRQAGGLATMRERKWIGRGVLGRTDGTASEGWLIHEEVTWGAERE